MVITQGSATTGRNGRTLVARFFGDLAAARIGLAQDELLDLLASDEDVRKAQRRLSHYSPCIDPDLPLPVALWARLQAAVEPLLSERMADGEPLYAFYYQQLRAVVEARYLTGAERVARHRALADYFARQLWRLGPNRWNRRNVRELVTLLERAGDRQAAGQALSELADDLEQTSHVQSDDPARIVALIDALHDHLYVGGYWSASQRLIMRQLAATQEQGDRRNEGNTLLGVCERCQEIGSCPHKVPVRRHDMVEHQRRLPVSS